MNSKPIVTSDDSHTLYHEKSGEHYHSTFGAITESEHIFIAAGLDYFQRNKSLKTNILEVGFGTGLNALLTYKYAKQNDILINYFGIEAFPISGNLASGLNYPELVDIDMEVFKKMHQDIETKVEIDSCFTLQKTFTKFELLKLPENEFDIVYFDAFSPEAQAELWTEEIFQKLFTAMREGGILTTYSCKGIVKRALKTAGFSIEKIPGPPGKREFLRAMKGFSV